MSLLEKASHHPLLSLLEERMQETNFPNTWKEIFQKLPAYFNPGSPPSNLILNEEYFEWIDLAEAAASAKNNFLMFELGAGYGRWCINAMIALKFLNPIPFHFIAVEAERSHFQFLKDYFSAHGLNLEEHRLIEAAVDTLEGHALFHMGDPNVWYGQCLDSRKLSHRILNSLKNAYFNLRTVKKMDRRKEVVRTITLNSILADYERIDLIDLDIQGAELEVLKASVDLLNQKVKRVHVGTHSKEIDRGLEELFRNQGWKNLHLYPLFSTCETPYGRVSFGDGVQSWINPRVK